MTPEQVGAGMYELGYRYRLTMGKTKDGKFVPAEFDALFVKTVIEVGPLMRTVYPEYCVHGWEIDSNGVQIPNASFERP